jgi:hypothetical protein
VTAHLICNCILPLKRTPDARECDDCHGLIVEPATKENILTPDYRLRIDLPVDPEEES